MSAVLALLNSRKDNVKQERERCARKAAWDWANKLYQITNSDKTQFLLLVKFVNVDSLKRPEEREFVVDSGVSMHMMSENEKNSDELDTVRRSRHSTVVLTGNGEVHTREVVVKIKNLLMIRILGVVGVQSHAMRLYMCLCFGLFASTHSISNVVVSVTIHDNM